MIITRRAAGAALVGGLALPWTHSDGRAQAKELVFCSWGGAYQEAIRKAWIEPWSKRTGVRVREDTNPEIARLKAMVDTNTMTWDVVTGGGSTVAQGGQMGLFEPVPADKVHLDHVFPEARHPYGVPSEIFSTLFAYSTTAFRDQARAPKTWADFFDPAHFPGRRTIYNRPQTVLEAALLGDGVPAGEVYRTLDTREGLDRAFAVLTRVKPQVAQWWSSGAQPVQLLASGDVVMSLGWNGRFQAGLDEGAPLRMVFEGQVAQVGFFMVPKGVRNPEAAWSFLDWIASTDAQGEFSKYIAYGPVTPAAYDRIPRAKWGTLPGSPEAKIELFLDIDWWARNAGPLTERYQAFIQS